MKKNVTCPICEKEFEGGSYDICPFCQWMYQYSDYAGEEDEIDDANLMTYNEARNMVKQGLTIFGNPLPKRN